MAAKIKTHDTISFTQTYVRKEPKRDEILKQDFGKFFIVQVQDLIRLIQLPVPPTRSTTHTLIYLTAGEAIMTIGSQTYTIYQDECLLVPAGQVFAFENVDINQGYLCNFHNDFIIGKFGKNELLQDFEFLQVWGNPRMQLDPDASAFVEQLFKRMYGIYAVQGLQNLDILQSHFISLLCELNRSYQPLSNSKQTQSIAISNQFKQLLYAHIKTKHLVTDYADLLHITPNHLNRIVKQITGKSPTKWIDEVLMMEAKVLLYQTNYSISEVAEEIGIFDSSYFSRWFKKYEGQTPVEFRNMVEKS